MSVALPTQGFRPFPTADPKSAPDTYPPGRRCALGECGCDAPALLSIYNPNETCCVCTVKIGRRIRELAAMQ